jgi:predicted flap endonuclease-1-like 5' DNA nuclease
MTAIETIERIGPVNAARLQAAGVASVDDLLARAGSAQGRDELAGATGVSGHTVLGWVNRADLFRVKGIGEEYADLLEEAGVDTVAELAGRNPDNLHQQLVTTNEAKGLERRLPSVDDVAEWVRHAKQLPRLVSY